MAKPTKTAPKRTNKSKTKKGKLDFLTNRINFKSRKTQFILTILVFALVGGAWFTYKSFAATEGVQVATYVGANLQPSSGTLCSDRKARSVADSQKSGNVWEVPEGGCIEGTYSPEVTAGHSYKVCIVAKGSRAKFKVWFWKYDSTYSVNSPTKYTKYCTASQYQTSRWMNPPVVTVISGSLHISMVTLERTGQPATNSAPAPAK